MYLYCVFYIETRGCLQWNHFEYFSYLFFFFVKDSCLKCVYALLQASHVQAGFLQKTVHNNPRSNIPRIVDGVSDRILDLILEKSKTASYSFKNFISKIKVGHYSNWILGTIPTESCARFFAEHWAGFSQNWEFSLVKFPNHSSWDSDRIINLYEFMEVFFKSLWPLATAFSPHSTRIISPIFSPKSHCFKKKEMRLGFIVRVEWGWEISVWWSDVTYIYIHLASCNQIVAGRWRPFHVHVEPYRLFQCAARALTAKRSTGHQSCSDSPDAQYVRNSHKQNQF